MTQQAKSTGITTHLSDFIETLQANDRRPRTIDSYTKDVRLFANWFRQEHSCEPILTDITPLDVRDYRTYLHQTSGLTPNTVNRRLASMRVFLEWAVEAGHLVANPAVRIRGIKSVDLAPRWLTRTEQHRLLNALERAVQAAQVQAGKQMTPTLEQALRDRAIILTLLNTGLRVLELAQLTLPDLTISERKGSLYVRDGKGGKARTVPLNGAARNALTAYLVIRPQNNHQHVFLGQQGPIGSRQLLRILKKYARRGSLEPKTVTVHALRHSFGKNLVDAGVSIDQVAMLLGHANLNTTRRYTTPGSGDLERAVEKVATEE